MNQFASAVNKDLTKSKKDARTANGAVTRSTSGQSHLDLFAIIGSARNAQNDVVRLFSKAYADDKALAIRIMLWARDVRGGAGERQAFRNVLRHLSENDPRVAERLLPFVAEYGRWDDVIMSFSTTSHLFKVAADLLKAAIESGDGLAAKWTPRKGDVAITLRNHWGMTPKQYRKFVVSHTNVVETLMCSKEWSAIEFDKLPSLASLRYQTAFSRNAADSYADYKSRLVKGEAKVNAATLFPHDIVANVRRRSADTVVLNEQWKALPDYLAGRSGKILPMSDVSGSMMSGIGGNTTCLDVSIALGIYTAERLNGPFKDMVLTFSTDPQFHKLKGVSINDRVNNLASANWCMSTDFQAAFRLVLNTATKHKVPQEDMPETILVISDMEFNAAGGNKTNFGAIKQQYKDAGYKMPNIVFWNVNGRAGNNPVKYDTDGTCMVSGYSPSILSTVMSGKEFDPMGMMFETVGKERYAVAEVVVA